MFCNQIDYTFFAIINIMSIRLTWLLSTQVRLVLSIECSCFFLVLLTYVKALIEGYYIDTRVNR